MAWTIENFEGVYMGGKPSNARVALFELCRALNQRERAAGFTVTEFYRADGTETDAIALEDLEGIRATGENSLAWQNLKRIRLGVENLVKGNGDIGTGTEKVWTVDSGTLIPYYVWTTAEVIGSITVSIEEELSIDIGADSGSTIWSDALFAKRPQDYRYFEHLRIALDALLYLWLYEIPEVTSGGRMFGSTDSTADVYASEAAAWAQRRRYSSPAYPAAIAIGGASNWHLSWGTVNGVYLVGALAWVTDPAVEYTFSGIADLAGAVVFAELTLEGGGPFSGPFYPGTAVDIDVNGATVHVPATWVVANEIDPLDVAGDVEAGIAYVVTCSHGLDEDVDGPSRWLFYVSRLDLRLDITGQLTDQE